MPDAAKTRQRQKPYEIGTLFVKALLGACLVFALIGNPVWTLCEVPDDPGIPVLDGIMLAITAIFVFEITYYLITDRSYRLSVFFVMDLLGTASMVFEMSFILQEGDGGQVDTVVLRSARAAKIGARAGRLLKLVKGFGLCMKSTRIVDENPEIEASVLAKRLTLALSTRVSVLTIGIVTIMPYFELMSSVQDTSMYVWAQQLEETYSWTNSSVFESAVRNLESFYMDSSMVPFRIEGWGEFQILPLRDKPQQKENIVTIPVKNCLVDRPGCNKEKKASIHFNITELNQWIAAADILVVTFILVVMVGMTGSLRTTLDSILVRPLESMMTSLRSNTEALFNQFNAAADEKVEEDVNDTERTELEAIERILHKLSRIARNAMRRNSMDQAELLKMDNDDKGVLVDMLDVKVDFVKDSTATELEVGKSWSKLLHGIDLELELELQSWEINTLELKDEELTLMVKHIFFKSEFGLAPKFAHDGAFESFMAKVKPQYWSVPYHCYPHAVDVLHTVWRLMCGAMGRRWLNEAEQYALLVAAYCHDLGHFGKTNPFLVESEHEMAIRYNDKSPLESMHCAKLFEICKDASSNAFGQMSRALQKESRTVCVAAILHTDNVNHFTMIKDIEQVYELQDDFCDRQARVEDGALLKGYKENMLEQNKLLMMELFLHFADVSNPLKPFWICYAWAQRVLDEFFAQGDEEKALGLPVGMLNDREKVNRPGSQHGFINFLVSPLVKTTVLLFPMFTELHVEMSNNLEKWRNLWLKEAHPSEADLSKKDEQVWAVRVMSDQLQRRKGHTDWKSWQTLQRAME